MEGVEIGNITIPAIKGDKGDKGDAGKIISLSVTMLASTATPTVTNTGTESEAQYILGIPVGTGVSSAVINEDGELVITLTDNTELNLGVIIPTSISNVSLDANYDFIITFSDGTTTVVGNIASEIQDLIDTALADYYDKDTTDGILDDLADDIKETYGHSLSLSLNQSTYVMTIGLVDYNGTTLDTKTVDLPLESVVVSGTYDNTTKKVILTLQNGSTVEFSVADLVSGLQSEITNANKLSADLVDDTNTTHKFVTSAQKTIIDSVETNYAHTLSISLNTTTNELSIGINDKSGTPLDIGIVDLDDTGFIKSTDYADYNKGGVVKRGNGFTTTSSGVASCGVDTYIDYQSKSGNQFISKGTLENVLNAKIGDINTMLDTINGEVI